MEKILKELQIFKDAFDRVAHFIEESGCHVTIGEVLYYARWGGYPDERSYIYKRCKSDVDIMVRYNLSLAKRISIMGDMFTLWNDTMQYIDEGIEDDRNSIAIQHMIDHAHLAVNKR